jgi:hypothetical protein
LICFSFLEYILICHTESQCDTATTNVHHHRNHQPLPPTTTTITNHHHQPPSPEPPSPTTITNVHHQPPSPITITNVVATRWEGMFFTFLFHFISN